jgi:hypothetical protein
VEGTYSINFITAALFDCDSTHLEYFLNSDGGSPESQGVYVFREDGTQLFFEQGYRLNNIGLSGLTNDPSRSVFGADSMGTYLIFGESAFAGQRKMYRFCGQLPIATRPQSAGGISGGRPQNPASPGFKVYPNPASDFITVEYNDLNGQRHARAQVWNLSGQLLKEVRIGQAFSQFHLDVSALAQGTYIVRIVANDGKVLQEKFIKLNP